MAHRTWSFSLSAWRPRISSPSSFYCYNLYPSETFLVSKVFMRLFCSSSYAWFAFISVLTLRSNHGSLPVPEAPVAYGWLVFFLDNEKTKGSRGCWSYKGEIGEVCESEWINPAFSPLSPWRFLPMIPWSPLTSLCFAPLPFNPTRATPQESPLKHSKIRQ